MPVEEPSEHAPSGGDGPEVEDEGAAHDDEVEVEAPQTRGARGLARRRARALRAASDETVPVQSAVEPATSAATARRIARRINTGRAVPSDEEQNESAPSDGDSDADGDP